jgi:hypothetical protein
MDSSNHTLEQYIFDFSIFRAATQLENDIAATWHELAESSPTYVKRYLASAHLRYEVEQEVKSYVDDLKSQRGYTVQFGVQLYIGRTCDLLQDAWAGKVQGYPVVYHPNDWERLIDTAAPNFEHIAWAIRRRQRINAQIRAENAADPHYFDRMWERAQVSAQQPLEVR